MERAIIFCESIPMSLSPTPIFSITGRLGNIIIIKVNVRAGEMAQPIKLRKQEILNSIHRTAARTALCSCHPSTGEGKMDS